jgi:hypothetical protein
MEESDSNTMVEGKEKLEKTTHKTKDLHNT